MDTAEETKATPEEQKTVAPDTSVADSAQSQEEAPATAVAEELSPQQAHEKALREAIEEPKEVKEEQPKEELLLGKYKSIDEVEKALSEATAEMNKARQEATLVKQRSAKQTTSELEELQEGQTSVEDDELKLLTSELNMDPEAAKKLISIVDRRTNRQFAPLVKSIKRAQTEAELMDLGERHSDLPEVLPKMIEIIKTYPPVVRKSLKMEDVYFSARAQVPRPDGNKTQQVTQDTLKQVQDAQRTATISGSKSTGITSGGKHIWTREEIGKLTSEQFTKNEKEITAQMNQGLIK